MDTRAIYPSFQGSCINGIENYIYKESQIPIPYWYEKCEIPYDIKRTEYQFNTGSHHLGTIVLNGMLTSLLVT